MFKFIKSFLEKREAKKLQKLRLQILELRHWTTKFFEDLQKSKGSVELPAWIECKNLMVKLNIDEKHPDIVKFYYKKLQKYKLSLN